MKKTWKQWIAIACVLSMIACVLPAMTLAEDEVATPTDLAPITEEPVVEEPTEEPGEEPEGEIPAPGIPELRFGNPGYRGTLKAGKDFTIILRSDRYASILVTLALSPKNGQAADTDGVKVLFNEKAKKLVRVEKEDADSAGIEFQFETYIAQDTEYTFVITSPFDADFVLTAGNRTAAAEQEDEEEEPVEEEPTEEEPTEEEPTEEEPTEEEPTGEEPEEVEPVEEEPEENEDGEDGNEAGDETNPEEPDEVTITEIVEEEEKPIHAWISANGSQDGETITLKANAEPELEGVPTWYTRNAQAEENEWKKAGYGENMTFEAVEGSEYRFILPDGTVSDVYKLNTIEEAAEEEPVEEPEEGTEDQPQDETDEEETEATEETQPEENPEELTEEETQEEETAEETEETAEETEETEETGEEETEETEAEETAEEKPAETDTEEPAAEEEETSEPEEETAEEENTEEEPTEETEVLPPDEALLALGYYGTQVVMSNGADIFDSMEEDAEPIGHLEAGEPLWIRLTENEGWAEIYRADETAPAAYIRWDDVLINQKPETEEEEEELPARSVEVTSTLWGMKSIPLGTEITMTAELINFREEDRCTYQWQYLDEQTNAYIDIPDANDLTYVYSIDTENFYYTWRLVVIIETDA